MTVFIFGYSFIALATAFSTVQDAKREELIASAICGIIWPIFITSRILRKILY
jgi:hypothetical protein